MTQFPSQPPYGQPPYGQQPYGQPPYGQQPNPGWAPFPGQLGGPMPPAARRPAPRLAIPGGLLGLAGVLGLIGALLPWAQFGPFTKSGTDGDGAITLVLALLVAAGGLWVVLGAPLGIPIAALAISALIALIALIDIADVDSTGLDVGSGLILTLVAGITGVAAGTWALVARSSARRRLYRVPPY